MPRCLIALGANLGDRRHTLDRAVELLGAEPQITLAARSRWHETAPIGGALGQDTFLNGVLALDTTLSPHELRAVLGRIEGDLGRTRGERWAARLIDLDLLLYEDLVVTTPSLVVPHPRMAFRRFVLQPAAEIAPDIRHPTIGWSMRELLFHLNLAVPYVALLGMPGSGKSELAKKLVLRLGGRRINDCRITRRLPGSPNPPSHDFDRQIQFLDQRAKKLAARHWPHASELVVSDFYFDQSLAYASMELASPELETFHRAWEDARANVVAPKLLIVLDDLPGLEARAGQVDAPLQSSPGETEVQITLRRNLLALAARPGIGPVLYAGHDRVPQFDEAVAAIAAMQSRG